MMLSKLGLFVTLTVALLAASLAEAQPTAKIPRLCFLTLYSVAERPDYGAFLHGLRNAGYVEGQNITIDYLSADGRFERFPTLGACPRIRLGQNLTSQNAPESTIGHLGRVLLPPKIPIFALLRQAPSERMPPPAS